MWTIFNQQSHYLLSTVSVSQSKTLSESNNISLVSLILLILLLVSLVLTSYIFKNGKLISKWAITFKKSGVCFKACPSFNIIATYGLQNEFTQEFDSWYSSMSFTELIDINQFLLCLTVSFTIMLICNTTASVLNVVYIGASTFLLTYMYASFILPRTSEIFGEFSIAFSNIVRLLPAMFCLYTIPLCLKYMKNNSVNWAEVSLSRILTTWLFLFTSVFHFNTIKTVLSILLLLFILGEKFSIYISNLLLRIFKIAFLPIFGIFSFCSIIIEFFPWSVKVAYAHPPDMASIAIVETPLKQTAEVLEAAQEVALTAHTTIPTTPAMINYSRATAAMYVGFGMGAKVCTAVDTLVTLPETPETIVDASKYLSYENAKLLLSSHSSRPPTTAHIAEPYMSAPAQKAVNNWRTCGTCEGPLSFRSVLIPNPNIPGSQLLQREKFCCNVTVISTTPVKSK
jgi:hypothetical protein